MANKKTLYDILELTPHADGALIDIAHGRLREAAAADADNSRRVLIEEAYRVLSDVERRAAYDASLLRLTTEALPVQLEEENTQPRTWMVWPLVVVALAIGLYWWRGTPRPPSPTVPASEVTPAPSSLPLANAQADAAPEPSPEALLAERAGSIALVVIADGDGNPIRSGSGVVIDTGAIVTSCQVTKGSYQIRVRVAGRTYKASLQSVDAVFDLCRLAVPDLSAPRVSIGSTSTLRTGQRVHAIGAPRGLDLTIVSGIVTALRETPLGIRIETTVPLLPGSSGGGLFDANGGLIGIVAFQRGGGEQRNTALPADWLATMRHRGAQAGTSTGAPDQATGADQRLVGNWRCLRPPRDQAVTLQLDADGAMTLTANGKPDPGRYETVGRVLTLSGRDTLTATIDEFADRRMVLRLHDQQRMTCDRQD